MGACVHAQSAGTATEAVAFRSELAGVTHPAEQFTLVLVGVGRVQHLVAQVALEALLVEFQSCGHAFLGGVHRFGAFGALGDFNWYERHLRFFFSFLSGSVLKAGRMFLKLGKLQELEEL